MKKTELFSERSVAEERTLETSLVGKGECFNMMALAEALGKPLLLKGPPGVGKTQMAIDYAKSFMSGHSKEKQEKNAGKIFIIETNEGTKFSELTGIPDFKKLFTQNEYELLVPIADADVIIINEIDKASTAIRNALLSIMNERILYRGDNKAIACKWKLFIATCNEIPTEEVNSPFWDRFVLKMEVNRMSAGEMVEYYKVGGHDFSQRIPIRIPTAAAIKEVEIPMGKLEKYLMVGYSKSSDRSLTFMPQMAKAVSLIWGVSIDKALVKTAQIMIDQATGAELQNKLMTPSHKAVMSKIEMIQSYSSETERMPAIAEIDSMIEAYVAKGSMDEVLADELKGYLNSILSERPIKERRQNKKKNAA